MGLPLNADGSLRPYTADEVLAFKLQSRGIRDGSHPTFARSMNSSTVRAVYFCAKDKLEDVITYFLGAAVAYNPGSGYRLSRLMPQTWPGKPNVAATQVVSAKGFKFVKDDPAVTQFPKPDYDRMEVEFLFEVVPFDLQTDAALEEGDERGRYVQALPTESDANYVTLPGFGGMTYRTQDALPPHNTTVPLNLGMTVITGIVSKKWHRLPKTNCWSPGSALWNRFYGDPEAGTLPYIGTVNKSAIYGYKAGTLLLMPPSEEIVYDPVTDSFVTNLTIRWQHKPQLHNWFPAMLKVAGVSVAKWAFVSNDGNYYNTSALPDGRSIFNAREHVQLFSIA